MSKGPIILAAILVAFASASAEAAYVLAPFSGGLPGKTVAPGDTLNLDFMLTSATDYTWAAAFTVDFSQPGLVYLGHAWQSPFQTTSVDNRSQPGSAATPTTLGANSYVATSNDPGTVDAYFENFLEMGEFTSGKLLTMSLQVPADFAPGAVTINTLPVAFDNGSPIPTTGASFTLTVVPQLRTWTGGGADSLLSTAANWLGDTMPSVGQPIVFGPDGAGHLNPTNDGATPLSAVGGITFDAGDYTLGGISELTVNGSITNNAAAAVIDTPVALAGTGIIDGGGSSGNTLTINGQVSGSVGLTKTGAGTVVLTQYAAYAGNTDVQAGVLELKGLSNGGSTTVSGTLIADYLRQDTLTINAGGKVEISGSGLATPIASDATAPTAPVPEPCTWLLMVMAAIAGLIAWRRR